MAPAGYLIVVVGKRLEKYSCLICLLPDLCSNKFIKIEVFY